MPETPRSTDCPTVIVVLPLGVPAERDNLREVMARYTRYPWVPRVTYPVRAGRLPRWMSRGTDRDLLGPVRDPHGALHAAGGPLARLDLGLLETRVYQQADARWRTWSIHVAATTPKAKPWTHFHDLSLKDPDAMPHEQARRQFLAQPGVLGMLAYNTRLAPERRLDPYQLEEFQAGRSPYVTLAWHRAVAGNALITPDGRVLRPATAFLSDELLYLGEAAAFLHRISPDHHLAAVTAAGTL